jgi:MEMO1 family protein
MSGVRLPAVAGQFYPEDPGALRGILEGFLDEIPLDPGLAKGAIVPHAGLVYSGQCAAHVFSRVRLPPVVVILAPNHTGVFSRGASVWGAGAFRTPLGDIPIAEAFAARLASDCPVVDTDPGPHRREHAVEVELPFLAVLAPESAIVPIVLPWDDWNPCRTLAAGLERVIRDWPEEVMLLASSDMTHFESAERAAVKDRVALAYVERLDGQGLLETCRRERITMCGRAPAATVLEAARLLGATRAELVDYRHSGLVNGDNDRVVAYAGVVIR